MKECNTLLADMKLVEGRNVLLLFVSEKPIRSGGGGMCARITCGTELFLLWCGHWLPSKMEVCLRIEMRQLMKEPNTRSRSDLPFSQMETANGKQCGVGRTRTNSRTLANVI